MSLGPETGVLDLVASLFGAMFAPRPTDAAAEAGGKAGDLHAELAALFDAQNTAGPDNMVIPANVLKVTVRKA